MIGRRAIAAALTASLALATGCAERADVLPPVDAPSGAARAAAPSEADETIRLRDWSAFGMPVPEGATVEEIGRTHAYYRVEGDLDRVVAFFAAQLPDFAVTRYDDGVKLEAQDRSDRSLYVHADDGEVLVTYYDQTPESVPGASTTPGGAPIAAAPVVAPDGISMVLSSNRRSASLARGTSLPGGEHRGTGSGADGGGAPSGDGTSDARRSGEILPRSPGPTGLPMGGSPDDGQTSPDDGFAPDGTPRIRRATRPPGGYNRGYGVDDRPRQLDFVHGDYQRPTNPDAWF